MAHLLVVDDANVVQYRRVTLGKLDGRLRVVTDGLKPGERVIVMGSQRVRPGMTVAPTVVDMETLSPPGAPQGKPAPAAKAAPAAEPSPPAKPAEAPRGTPEKKQ